MVGAGSCTNKPLQQPSHQGSKNKTGRAVEWEDWCDARDVDHSSVLYFPLESVGGNQWLQRWQILLQRARGSREMFTDHWTKCHPSTPAGCHQLRGNFQSQIRVCHGIGLMSGMFLLRQGKHLVGYSDF